MTDNNNNSRRRKKRSPCIPGLIQKAFTIGSRHSAPCPTLISSDLEEATGYCSFTWKAKGSSNASYDIQATGKLVLKVELHDEFDIFNEGQTKKIPVAVGRGLKVTCSCPDGQRQAVASLSQNKIVVCKHAAAALESVLDPEAEHRFQADVAKLRREWTQAQEEAARQQEEVAQKQEQEMPGERARIEYGLEALSRDEIQSTLEASCKTMEGLRALAVIFPESVMPTPQTKFCVRCKKDYDERYSQQKVCRLEHPEKNIEQEWDGSKISWKHCFRCDGHFNMPEYYCRRRGSPFDVGKWCFQGEHTQDEEKVREEKWDADPGDLVY